MNEVIRAAGELQEFCEQQAWKFCFIGGVALQRWGQPRETIDVDLTLITGFDEEGPFIQTLLQRFEGRIANTADFALQRRVLLLRSSTGVGLDIALGGLPYESLIVQRSSLFEYPPNVALRTCSAEDLIVLKAFASRGQDWIDVEGIIVRQAGKLDWDFVHAQLAPLVDLKESPEILSELEQRRIEFEK